MNYILRDIFNCFRDEIKASAYPPKAFEDKKFTQKSFWEFIFSAAGCDNLTLSASQVSRWTNGDFNFDQKNGSKLLSSLNKKSADVTTSINQLIEDLSQSDSNLNEKLATIFKEHNIFFLLELEENVVSDPAFIIYSIITGHECIAARSKLLPENNPCLRNFPYATTYKNILPIDTVQEFFKEALSKYHYAIILGIPGIGKLSQAVYYTMNSDFTYYYCLNYEDSIESTFLHYNFEEATVTPNRKYRLSAQFKYLKERNNAVVIINNVKTDIQNDSFFSPLTKLPIRIIFLSSCLYPASSTTLLMPHLSLEQCIKLFYRNCPRFSPSTANNAILNNIIDMIEHHTLTLELIAKLIQNSSLSLSDVDFYIKNNPLFDNDTILYQQQKDGYILRDTYKNIILNLFDIEKIASSNHELLNYITLLPDTGYNRVSFNTLINDLKSNKINRLINLGWVRLNEQLNTLSLHPLIQSCFLQKLSPTPALCLSFLKRYINIIETENYDNETEAIWMGLSILDRLQENSSEWFETSYIILNFLRKEKVDYSFIEKLLVKISKIILPENMDLIKGFYIRHVDNMYMLYRNNGNDSQCTDVYRLIEDTLAFCAKQNTVPSFTLIDLLISQQNNLMELCSIKKCQIEDSYIINSDLSNDIDVLTNELKNTNLNQLMNKLDAKLSSLFSKSTEENSKLIKQFIFLKIATFQISLQLKTLSSTWINNPDTICSLKVLFHTCKDVKQMPKYLQFEFYYYKGMDAYYMHNFDYAPIYLRQVYEYYKCHPQYKFNYKNLRCQYLILDCQRKKGASLDKEIIDSLENALNSLPDPIKTSLQFIDLTNDFYCLLDDLEDPSTTN